MAQSGYTPILLYGSNTASSVPSASNLTSSTSGVELALNYTDGKLYYKDNSGVVQLLASKAAAAGVLSFSAGSTGLTPSTATSGAVTLAGTLGISNGGTGITSFGTGVQTALGVNVGTAGSFLVNGGVLGTPSSGTVTNLTGTASININGTVGATTPSTGAFTTLTGTGQLTLTNASNYNLYASGAGANYFAGNVGIGQSYGLNKLTVAGYTPGADGAYATYRGAITLNDGGITTVNANGGFEFKTSVFGSGYGSKIVSFDDGSMAFAVRANSATFSEYARISQAGTISLGAAPGSESLRVTPVASAVNYLGVYGSATGNSVNIRADGSDTNIGMLYDAKGTFGHTFRTNVYGGAPVQFAIGNTTSAVNYLQVTGQVAGESPNMSAQGSDANININLIPKGTGGLATYSTGQSVANISTTTFGGSLLINDVAGAAGNGGAVMFGAANGAWRFAAIKSFVTNGASNTQGDLYFLTRRAATDATLTTAMLIASSGVISLGSGAGSESLRVTPVASAVNYVNILGGATGNGVNIYAQGANTNVGMYYISQGSAFHTFITGWPSNAVQFNIAHTASAVNYLTVTGSSTGFNPALYASGSDTNISMTYAAKGTGSHQFFTNNTFQFVVAHTASAVNYLQVTGGATGAAATLSAQGSDTNIDLALTPKGTGVLSFGTYTAGIVAQAGYISIKDAAGNVRRLLVG